MPRNAHLTHRNAHLTHRNAHFAYLKNCREKRTFSLAFPATHRKLRIGLQSHALLRHRLCPPPTPLTNQPYD